MNIFYLSNNTKECAEFHMDKHVVKMILEYSQILCTSHRIIDNINESHFLNEVLYKKTHQKHPSVLWCMKCEENYMWLYSLLVNLIDVFKKRYNRHQHKSENLLKYLINTPNNINKNEKFSPPPLTIKEESKISSCHIECYKRCYQTEKKHLGWGNEEDIPSWYYVF
jgi:hypothetical protein